MGGDRDAGDDALDVAAVVEQRGQAGPRLLVHPVPLVEHADAAGEHRRDQRRGVIGDLAALGQDGGDDQVFGPRVGRALVDEERLLAQPRGRHRQRRLADARAGRSAGARAAGRAGRPPASTPGTGAGWRPGRSSSGRWCPGC